MTSRTFAMYGLYATILFFVFSIVLFPGQEAALRVSRYMTSLVPGVTVSIKMIVPVLPFSIRCLDPQVSAQEIPPVHLDSITITPDIWSVFGHAKAIRLQGISGRGQIAGRLSASLDGLGSDFDAVMKWTDFSFSDVNYISAGSVFGLSGVVNGNLSIGRHPGERLQGKGTYRVSACKVEVQDPLINQMGIGELTFKSIDLVLDIDDTKLIIQEVNGMGVETNLSATGYILLKQPLAGSGIYLKGYLQPNPTYVKKLAGISSISMLFDDSNRQGIPFTITGTVEKPIIGL